MRHTQTYTVSDHMDKKCTRLNLPESQNEFCRGHDVPLLVEELLAKEVRGGRVCSSGEMKDTLHPFDDQCPCTHSQ